MADTSQTQALPPSSPSASLISTTLLMYALYGIAAIVGPMPCTASISFQLTGVELQ